MADIKITLSADKNIFAADINKEIQFLHAEGSLWYPLTAKVKPKNVFPGDWVYFILKGRLVGRAPIDALEAPQPEVLKTYKKRDIVMARWGVRTSRIEKPIRDVAANGFQSFRYLTPTESHTFPSAF
jgi:hypothetical protein